MAKKVEIELDVTGNIVESTKNLKAMKQELKGLDVGTAEFKKLYNEIDDLEDKIKSAKSKSSDWIDSLEASSGPLGMVGAGLNKVKVATQSWGAALKATGIGLIVSLIGGLVAAFSQTEGSMKKLEPLMIGMEKIFGGIVEVAMPLVDTMLDLGLKALPYVTAGFKYAYAAVAALFSYIKNMGSAVVKVWKGIFTFDWQTIKEGVSDMGATFGKVADDFTAATDRFDKGYAKTTKTQKKNAADAKEAADKALAEKLKQMEAMDKIDEARMEKMKAEALALATTEQQKLDIEKSFAKKSYDLKKKDLEDKQKLYDKSTVEYKGYTADLIKLDADYTNTKTANDDKQKQLNETKQKEFFEKEKVRYQNQLDKRLRDEDVANEKELQALDVRLKKGEIKQYQYNLLLHDLKQQQLNDKMAQLKKEQSDEEDHYTDLFNKGRIKTEDYLTKLQETEKTFGDKRLETLKLQGENEYAYAQQLAQMLVETKLYEKDAIIALEQAKVNAIATLGNIISQLAGQNKELAVLGLLVSQGAAIADILTKYFRTKAELIGQNALYASMIPNPITAAIGIAGVAATTAGMTSNTIGMAAGLAGVGAAIASGIASISSAGGGAAATGEKKGNGYGEGYATGGIVTGPGTATSDSIPARLSNGEAVMTAGAVTMFGPLLSMLNQMGGGTRFGKGMVASYDNPKSAYPSDYAQTPVQVLKTYVVEGELTSAQQKQARLKDLSTI